VDAWHGAGKTPTAADERAFCEAVERLVMERRAGRVVGPEGCDPLLWELLIVWEARQYGHEAFARRSPFEGAAEQPEPPDREPQMVTIIVDGRKRIVPTPPPGWAYDKDGTLFCTNPGEGRPIGDTGLRTQPSPRVIGGPLRFECEHARHEPTPSGQLRCLDCGSVGN
jgi:hypothetical protein